MKIKKYTNGAWTDLDKPVKKFATYTDEATTLPLTIQTSATDAVENYQVYGTSEGAGVETENLFDGEWQAGYWALSDGQHRNSTHWVCSLNKFPCVAGSAYSFKYFDNSRYYSIGWYDSNGTYISMDSEQNSDDTGYRTFTAVAPNNAANMAISIGSYPGEYDLVDPSTAATLMLVPGSTAPTSYIPYGYKIPISLESGEQQSNYDLFIGDSKLYEDEYLDFESQKVYKYVDGVLTPQDPPAPFPAIQAYKGENTLSVDTTVQPEKVAVEYEGWKGVGGVEKYQNGEWSDNNGT